MERLNRPAIFSKKPAKMEIEEGEKDKLSWLVVLTILNNISQWEGLSHKLWKIKTG